TVVERSVPLPVAGDKITIPLGPGPRFWRIADRQGPVSETRSFDVVSRAGLEPLDPPEQWPFEGSGSREVLFRWFAGSYHDVFRLRIATDPGFKNLVHDAEVEGVSQ